MPEVRVQQTTWNYVLAKIDRIYTTQIEFEKKKKLQATRQHRRQLLNARSLFQKELDQGLSPKMQAGLGQKVTVDRNRLPQFHFVVQFRFLGQQWLLTRNQTLFRYKWRLFMENQLVFSDCATSNLEKQLCYALGRHKNSIRSKIRVLAPSPSPRPLQLVQR